MPVIPISRPTIGDAEAEAAKKVILSGWVTQGPEVAKFESDFADYLGATHACAVSSCTAALHLALLAVGIKPGDEVVTVSHSFIATANSIFYCGAKPVFVDVQPHTYNIDPDLIEKVITEKTRAILCVHQIGMPCDITAIMSIANKHNIPVIEDAACAIGSEIKIGEAWQKIGKPYGDIACFSFHPRKVITTGDGGMITTSNGEWDAKFRLWRQHGMSVPDVARHKSASVIFESYLEPGFNYRMTDIQAAVGRQQLKRLPEIIDRRSYLAKRYRTMLANFVPSVVVQKEPVWAKSNWQSFCILLPEKVDQLKVMQAMLDIGIATRRGVMCSHREPAYKSGVWWCGDGPGPCGCKPGECSNLKNSEAIQDHGLILPMYHDMTDQEQDRVISALVAAIVS